MVQRYNCPGCQRLIQRGQSQCTVCGKILDNLEPACANVPSKTINKPIRSKVAGVSHQNDNGSSRQEILSRCKMTDIFTLKRCPIEEDPNGIILLRDNGEQVGWVTRTVAAELAPYMDKGTEYNARITALTGGGRYTRGCNIEIHEGGSAEMHAYMKSTTTKIVLAIIILIILVLGACLVCTRSIL